MEKNYDFSVSGLWLRVETDRNLTVPENFRPFALETTPQGDPHIRLQVFFGPQPEGQVPSHSFSWQGDEAICRFDPAVPGEPMRLYIPHSFADDFCTRGNWMLYMPLERMILGYDRFLLHASAVIHQGKAYLFSAPSGGGKSTHAELWRAHYGARILNGDKVVLEVQNGGCIAWGSPVAGSSGIYENLCASVGGIFVLHKAPHDRLTPTSKRAALLALYSETIRFGTDGDSNTRLLDLLEKLLSSVPVCSLECLPEKSAVDCILSNLEGMTK